MDAEELAFIAAICSSPGDDAPRLVYADWLDEHDRRERAEFIRVQCRMAYYERVRAAYEERRREKPTMSPFGGHCECGRLEDKNQKCEFCTVRDRENELLTSARAEWLGCPPGCVPTAIVKKFQGKNKDQNELVGFAWWQKKTHNGKEAAGTIYTDFTRGFPEFVSCDAEDWARNADALFWHPRQKMECRACHGQWKTQWGAGGEGVTRSRCERCDEGVVARPCPPTAHPVTRVLLTHYSLPFFYHVYQRAVAVYKMRLDVPQYSVVSQLHGYREAISVVWPGLDINLPAELPGPNWEVVGDGFLPRAGWGVSIVDSLHEPGGPQKLYVMEPSSRQAYLYISYPVESALGAPPARGNAFGPVRGFVNDLPVTIHKAIVKDVRCHSPRDKYHVEAVAMGEPTYC